MPVTTRSQTRQKLIQNQALIDKLNLSNPESPPILSEDDPAAGKPPCYLTWGRFLTEKNIRSLLE